MFDDSQDSNVPDSISIEEEFYGEKGLRWYQVAARNAIAEGLNQGINRILVVLPTGAGKTLTIAASLDYQPIREALGVTDGRPLRVLFAAHKHRLLTQAEQTFTAESNVQLFCQSIFSDIPPELLEAGWDVTVLDESHHESCMTFQLQLEHIGDRPILGLTATPDRADGCLIKFEKIINPISREQAVKEGWLAETYLHSFVDTPHKNKTGMVTDIIEHFGHQMGQTMVFMRTKKEVQSITDLLNDKGYIAVAILNQSEKELDEVLNAFSAGLIQFIINCNKINEGIDTKGCTDVLLGRQFGSYPQLNQVIGRASRPDCDCNVWEMINPLSGSNLDTTVVVGTPKTHRLVYKVGGEWEEQVFNYTGTGHRAIEPSERIRRSM